MNVVVAPENRGRPRKSPRVLYRPHHQSVYTLVFRQKHDGEDTIRGLWIIGILGAGHIVAAY